MAIGVLTGQMGRSSVRPNRQELIGPLLLSGRSGRGGGGWFCGGNVAREKALKPSKGGHNISVFGKVVKIP